MIISQNGINLIKKYEGCALNAYKCPAGVWTIGYGHTGNDVYEGLKISQKDADYLLSIDLHKFVCLVSKYDYKYDFTQNEFDALVSFAYNIGSIDQLTAKGTRSKSLIAKKILLYNKASGKVLKGLVRRREDEQRLFLNPSIKF